ncbi:tRNA (adenine(22)-N(1))-methyltransferase [Paenibacillus tarimensis]|uniref:tRNA (adenine(22)-N(1))-methyltransferase n=1 Tax=Paenibacillus tarimensis TaxID=416012 RepID=UPI001F434942|nr:class I SAM-dependent methyltransferase [Paenibacillus tarimensis]MCF2942078.1 class I SAM-dependent methyltransferase [Paenibacillus tarimensis]
MLKLSRRLQTIAGLVPQHSRVADIGSDHGLLPVYLLQTGRSDFAVAGELNEGPLQAAVRQIEAAGLGGRIAARRGNGLAVIEPGEVECVTIAGMGGALMAGILSEGLAAGKLEGVTTLVLQPNVGEDLVRRWLLQHHWSLAAERLVEEDGKWYEVLLAVRITDADTYNTMLYNTSFLPLDRDTEEKRRLLLTMGPWLLRQPSDVLKRKWQSEADKLRKICARINRSDSAEAAEKLREMEREIETIEEVLGCLQTDKRSFS